MYKKRIWLIVICSLIMSIFLFYTIDAYAAGNNSIKRFLPLLKEINLSIEADHWDDAKVQGDQLIKLYKKNLWKLQLLGDEREYEQAEEEIRTLYTAILEEDKTESILQISKIRTVISQLFAP